MRVVCDECGQKAVIYSRHVKDPKVSDLYCTCPNPECAQGFVMTLAKSHVLSPSQKQADQQLLAALRRLPKQDFDRLVEQAAH